MPGADAPIFLIGFMASGKTTVGKLVAAKLGWAFEDLDALVTAAAAKSVSEIFASEGEAGFRRREREALARVAGRARVVIATGGGAACREDSLALMLSAGRVVTLAVSPAEAIRRTGAQSGRPLLDASDDPVEAARRLLGERHPFYGRAHLRVETDGRRPSDVAASVVADLGLGVAQESQ